MVTARKPSTTPMRNCTGSPSTEACQQRKQRRRNQHRPPGSAAFIRPQHHAAHEQFLAHSGQNAHNENGHEQIVSGLHVQPRAGRRTAQAFQQNRPQGADAIGEEHAHRRHHQTPEHVRQSGGIQPQGIPPRAFRQKALPAAPERADKKHRLMTQRACMRPIYRRRNAAA